MSIASKTFMAGIGASLWRLTLTPIETIKAIHQVNGHKGAEVIMYKIRNHGLQSMFHGSMGSVATSMIGFYPWFMTYNYLDESLPKGINRTEKTMRNASIGFTSSLMSDVICNVFQVLKTTKQTHHEKITYLKVAEEVIEKEGLVGLLGRGLKTRILCNCIQGMMFSVIWKYLQEKYED